MHVRMYACMHVCTYVCVHVCMCACVHVCMCACVHVCMYACMHVCMYACMHVCMLGMYVCMYVCMYVRMYVCMCQAAIKINKTTFVVGSLYAKVENSAQNPKLPGSNWRQKRMEPDVFVVLLAKNLRFFSQSWPTRFFCFIYSCHVRRKKAHCFRETPTLLAKNMLWRKPRGSPRTAIFWYSVFACLYVSAAP